jgi:hypothetical protein
MTWAPCCFRAAGGLFSICTGSQRCKKCQNSKKVNKNSKKIKDICFYFVKMTIDITIFTFFRGIVLYDNLGIITYFI